jgi:hypothetical protein
MVIERKEMRQELVGIPPPRRKYNTFPENTGGVENCRQNMGAQFGLFWADLIHFGGAMLCQ